jgi:hypothetical protein
LLSFQAEVLKETYDFKTFYSPEKWQPMLEEADYQEMEEDMKKAKAAKWATKTQRQLDMEDDEEGAFSDNLDEIQAQFDTDYEAREVPVADVLLDAESADMAASADRNEAANEAVSNGGENSAEAEKVAAWMDVIGDDFQFSQKETGNDDDPHDFFKSLLPSELDSDKQTQIVKRQTQPINLSPNRPNAHSQDFVVKDEERKKRSADGDDDYSNVAMVSQLFTLF